MDMKSLYLTVPLAPLAGAALAGLFCRVVPRWFAAGITILGVAISLVASLLVLQDVLAIPLTVTCTLGPQVAVSRSM